MKTVTRIGFSFVLMFVSVTTAHGLTVDSIAATSTSLSSYILGSLGIRLTGPSAKLEINGSNTTDIGLIIKGSSGQLNATNYFEIKNNSGTIATSIKQYPNYSTGILSTLGAGGTDAASSQLKFNYGSGGGGGDVTGQLNGTDQYSFGFNNAGSFGGSSGVSSGRTIYFYDRVGATYVGAFNGSGDFYVGPSTTRYALLAKSPNVGVTALTIDNAGNIGIGTTSPATKLDVSGLIRTYQTSTTTCSTSVEGSIFYNSSNKHFWGCDGTSWNRLDL